MSPGVPQNGIGRFLTKSGGSAAFGVEVWSDANVAVGGVEAATTS